MSGNILIYILSMAITTYLIRMLPLALITKKITNKYIKSFLYYVPFVTLAVMVFPAILNSTSYTVSALTGFITALILAFFGGSLFLVSASACIVVFITELLIKYIF